MSTVIRQIPPSQAFKPELQCADFVELALMPDAVITAELVSASAFDRLDDFRVLADIVRASPSLAAYRERWGLRSLISAIGERPGSRVSHRPA